MKKFILLSLLVSVFTGAGCGSVSRSAKNDLDGTSWSLISFNGEPLIADTAMTASFEDGQVSGSASCNHYFGGYQSTGNSIELKDLAWTEMACLDPEGVMDQEQQLMSMFLQAESFSIQNQRLQITTGPGDLMLFQQAETQE
jgi:heat shock protein HslJ